VKQRKWTSSDKELGVWQAGTVVTCTNPYRYTHFAIARTEEPNGSVRLRLFYQSINGELRVTSFNSEKLVWEDVVVPSNRDKLKPTEGTSLVVSTSGPTRLFYLALNLQVVCLKESSGMWESSKLMSPWYFTLARLSILTLKRTSSHTLTLLRIVLLPLHHSWR
jgi:hypothetical protein